MLGAWVNIASYECKGTRLAVAVNLMDVFVPCEVVGDMNS